MKTILKIAKVIGLLTIGSMACVTVGYWANSQHGVSKTLLITLDVGMWLFVLISTSIYCAFMIEGEKLR